MVLELLPAVALAIAWATFRVNRLSDQKSALVSARELLRSLRHGMIRVGPLAWGDQYFSRKYTPDVVARRVDQTRQTILGRRHDQVFVVPTEPLKLLATTSPYAISASTIAAANTALWRVEVFNQLVLQQTIFNAEVMGELTDPATPPSRLLAIAEGAARLSEGIHRDGIGLANAAGGWYSELKEAVAANIRDLEQRMPWRSRYGAEQLFILFDLVVAAFCVWIVTAAIV